MQEFRIQTSSFAPEFGRTPGAQVSIVTRSGTNALHGSLFEYFRNDALDASDWFVNVNGLRKPEERFNDFGGVLGGPVRKDRTFFFFSHESLRLKQPATQQSAVPDEASRQAAPASMRPYLNAYPVANGASLGAGRAQFNASFAEPIFARRGQPQAGSRGEPEDQRVRPLQLLAVELRSTRASEQRARAQHDEYRLVDHPNLDRRHDACDFLSDDQRVAGELQRPAG